MALQYSTNVRDAQTSAIQTTVGTTGTVKIFTGSEPANCAAADPLGPLATIALPAAFMTSASGTTTIAGSWAVAAAAGGTAATFRMYAGAGTCHIQGNVTATGGGGNLTLDNTSISSGQTITVTAFTITAGNA
jgi:hypothetical protein